MKLPFLAAGLCGLAALSLACPAPALAQATLPERAASAPARAASAPARAASAPARAASAPERAAPAAGATQRLEITGGRDSDTDQRRRSTAAKIIIGREDIERFGDSTVGEVLRRLPGVTTPGAPGRGGPPRMRGLGNGYTQLLLDGQRLPPGFSLESISPEQIERIEILRAPTAETGAQAIAGTINIVLREGFKQRLNDLRLGLGTENGRYGGGGFWTHNDSAGNLTYTLSAGLFSTQRRTETRTDEWVSDIELGTPLDERHVRTHGHSEGVNLHLNARLNWRLGAAGDSLVLMPGLFANNNASAYQFEQQVVNERNPQVQRAASGTGHTDSRYAGPRLGWQYKQRLSSWRVESGGHLGSSRSRSDSHSEDEKADASVLRTADTHTQSSERSLRLNLKGSSLLGPDGSEHSLVLGTELEGAARKDTKVSLEDGQPAPALENFGEDFRASTLRYAAFIQDEWSLNPKVALHAGLRWEGITTRGDDGLGNRPQNRNSIWTPLVHLVWKPDPKVRDQVRASLTRSWRAPSAGALIGRPVVSRLYPVGTTENTRTNPDAAGNPDLQPELASGLDIAYESFLDGGGLLSANLFYRRINHLMRSTVEEENVSWSALTPRWVRRTRNIGLATTMGLELEAKFRLNQLITSAPAVEVRSNLSFYHSRVDQVPGPNNRLDQQARATGNLGADYRLRGTPLTLGANINWVPATTTRLADDQVTSVSTKRVWDAFVLWTFSPGVGLRLMANNVLPREYFNDSQIDSLGPLTNRPERTHNINGGASYTQWQARLELKL